MKVRDSQAYRKMDMTRKHTSRILELREILLSFQPDFNLVNAAVQISLSLMCAEQRERERERERERKRDGIGNQKRKYKSYVAKT